MSFTPRTGLGILGAVALGVVGCAPPALELRTDSVRLVVHIEGDARVLAGLREKLTALRHCFGVAGGSRREATLELTVTFRTSGQVKNITSNTTLKGWSKRCVMSRISAWRVAASSAERRFGPYEITFTPRRGSPQSGPGGPPIRPTRPRPRRKALWQNVSLGRRVRAKIRARVYGLRLCYNRLLVTHPTLSGAVKISFWIQQDGSVKQVQVGTNARWPMPPGMLRCVRDKVARWHLARIPRPTYYGPFVVRFTPGP